QGFEAAREATQRFQESLKEANAEGEFAELKLNLSEAVAGIQGNEEAVKRFRRALVEANQVTFSATETDGLGMTRNVRLTEDQLARLREEYIETGRVAANTFTGLDVSTRTSGIVNVFEGHVRSARRARE